MELGPPQKSAQFDRNLDVLRALAVITVLAYHTGETFGATVKGLGHFGVVIFFVHTARVLMGSMERLQGPHWIRRFYIQRLFRIYPLAVLCVVTALIFHIPTLSAGWAYINPPFGIVVANLLLVQNFLPYISISAPMWSLPYEVQMYLVLPLIFIGIRKAKVPRERAFDLYRIALVLAILESYFSPRAQGIIQYVPCFMAGVLAFTRRDGGRLPFWLWPGLIVTLGFAYCMWPEKIISDYILSLILGSTIRLFGEAPDGVLSRAAQLVARYSYGIYLSHMPLLWVCFHRFHAARALQWAAFVPLVVLVPIALYHLVEHPMILVGGRLASHFAKSPNDVQGRAACARLSA